MKVSTVEQLPRLARDLVEVIGLNATLRFVEAYGGRTLDLAKGKRIRGKAQIQTIAEKIGKLAADKMAVHLGGAPFFVPKCAAALRAMRDAKVHARFDELTGKADLSARRAVAQMVDEFGVVDRTLWRILKRAVPDGGNPIVHSPSPQADFFA